MEKRRRLKTNHSLIRVLFALLDVGDGLGAEPVGDLVGAQGDAEDVLVVAVLILAKRRDEGRGGEIRKV